MDLLKAASAKLAAARSMSFTSVVSYEYPSDSDRRSLYRALRRHHAAAGQAAGDHAGDGPASEFYYDGKSMMAYAPAENLVAVAAAPPTIDGALKAAFDNADIYYPFTDLIVADPYAALTDGTILAFYIGPSQMVGGVKTDMLAWANPDVFLQIWIGADDKLPRRIRAVYSADPAQLRHQMDLSNWQLDAAVPAEAFTSEKAKSAKPIAFNSPMKALAHGGAKPPANATPGKAPLPQAAPALKSP